MLKKILFNQEDLFKVPSLLDYPVKMYRNFLLDKSYIKNIFKSIFPVVNNSRDMILDYVDHELELPAIDEDVSKLRGSTYSMKINVTFSLKQGKDHPVEKSVYLGDIPLITDQGSFIINGHEKVLVSQLQKAPGIFFHRENRKEFKKDHTLTIIPYIGSWCYILLDSKNDFFFRIDKRKKIHLSIILDDLGFSPKGIFDKYVSLLKVQRDPNSKKRWLVNNLSTFNYYPLNVYFNGKLVGKAGKKVSPSQLDKQLYTTEDNLFCKILLLNKENYTYQVFNNSIIDSLQQDATIEFAFSSYDIRGVLYLLRYYSKLHKVLSLDTQNIVSKYLKENCFSESRYDLSDLGRKRLNQRLRTAEKSNLLTPEDLVTSAFLIFNLISSDSPSDDIDDFRNKKIKSPINMLHHALKLGVLRISKLSLEAMSYARDQSSISNLVNSSPFAVAMKTLFLRGSLIQFMDQTNALSGLSHKRRISSLGSGGITKERSGLEARDIHNTHYGKICAIETPEGQSCGLVNALGCFAHVNEFGFVTLPYAKVVDSHVVLNKIEFLDSDQEFNSVISQFSDFCKKTGKIKDSKIYSRYKGDVINADVSLIQYMDISPKQMVGVGASLIPFLEHNDPKRALMGANMQRQALPLVNADYPIVGTGMEDIVASHSGACVLAKKSGTVVKVNSHVIVVKPTKGLKDIYFLHKYRRSNQKTCINQKPIVNVGDKVNQGDILADGFSIKNGHLALGRNVRIAFSPFHGNTFEDAIVVSERLLEDESFTSVQIEEFICSARYTKIGQEEITADIPGLSSSDLKYLDENGVIKVGSPVKPGDILVGRITPKADQRLSSEEKLLYAIFGKKALDVKDTSLRAGHHVFGRVIDVHILTPSEAIKISSCDKEARETEMEKLMQDVFESDEPIKDLMAKDDPTDEQQEAIDLAESYFHDSSESQENLLAPGVSKMVRVVIARKSRLQVGDKLSGRHGNKGVISKVLPKEDMPYDQNGESVDIILNPLGITPRMNLGQLHETQLGAISQKAKEITGQYLLDKDYKALRKFLSDFFDQKDINKYSISKLKSFATEVYLNSPRFVVGSFSCFDKKEIDRLSNLCGLPVSGKVKIFDGLTGRSYAQDILVGSMYIMKLNHLVEDKMHARSTGSYTLVAQQPLGGKSQKGGQRLGEMESSAIQAYGAAYTLQEMLTVKSDDILGRNMLYRKIIKNDLSLKSFTPESFKVLQKELAALCISLVTVVNKKKIKGRKIRNDKKQ